MQRNVALQAAMMVELSSTFRNVARQVAACEMSIATLQPDFIKINQSQRVLRFLEISR